MTIATSLGAFSGACMSHKVGRKKALLVSNLFLFQGCYLFLITPSHLINLIGRLMIGVGLGIGCLTSPIYITETCPPQISGRINSIRDFFTSTGITFLNLMNLQYVSRLSNYSNIYFVYLLFVFHLMLDFLSGFQFDLESNDLLSRTFFFDPNKFLLHNHARVSDMATHAGKPHSNNSTVHIFLIYILN